EPADAAGRPAQFVAAEPPAAPAPAAAQEQPQASPPAAPPEAGPPPAQAQEAAPAPVATLPEDDEDTPPCTGYDADVASIFSDEANELLEECQSSFQQISLTAPSREDFAALKQIGRASCRERGSSSGDCV